VTQLTSEYGQEQFHFIMLNVYNKFVSVLGNYHMLIVQNMIDCQLLLFIESKLCKDSRAKLHVRFGHIKECTICLDWFCSLELETCHASVAQDIEDTKMELVYL